MANYPVPPHLHCSRHHLPLPFRGPAPVPWKLSLWFIIITQPNFHHWTAWPVGVACFSGNNSTYRWRLMVTLISLTSVALSLTLDRSWVGSTCPLFNPKTKCHHLQFAHLQIVSGPTGPPFLLYTKEDKQHHNPMILWSLDAKTVHNREQNAGFFEARDKIKQTPYPIPWNLFQLNQNFCRTHFI